MVNQVRNISGITPDTPCRNIIQCHSQATTSVRIKVVNDTPTAIGSGVQISNIVCLC